MASTIIAVGWNFLRNWCDDVGSMKIEIVGMEKLTQGGNDHH